MMRCSTPPSDDARQLPSAHLDSAARQSHAGLEERPMVKRVAMRLTMLALAALLVAPAAACDASDSPLQAELHKRKETRFAKAAAALKKIEDDRLGVLAEKLPAADATAAGGDHPMLTWRRDGADRKDEETLDALMADFKGTPSEDAARKGAAFIKASRDYWATKGSIDRYEKFLRGYVRDAGTDAEAGKADPFFVGRPFVAEAAFDVWYLHAARYFKTKGTKASITSVFKYWQIAFSYPSKARESFSEYVTRLCLASSIRDQCKSVVHELRPMAVTKPYLEWNKKQTSEFAAAYDVAVLAEVARRYLGELDKALAEVPDFTEDPVLPSSYSSRAASSALSLRMNKAEGVMLHDQQVADAFGGRIPGTLASKAAEVIEVLKNTPGNMIDFERIVLEMPGTAKGSALGNVVQAFPVETVRQFDFIGRRREDHSLRKTGVLLRIPGPDESRTMSYQFNGDSKKTSCSYLGRMGRPAIGRKSPGSYLVVTKDSVRAAKLSRDEEGNLVVGDKTLDVKPDAWGEVQTWADANLGIIRLYMSSEFSYDEILQWASGVMYQCADKEIALDDMAREKMTVKCGNVKGRDVTVAFALCD